MAAVYVEDEDGAAGWLHCKLQLVNIYVTRSAVRMAVSEMSLLRHGWDQIWSQGSIK